MEALAMKSRFVIRTCALAMVFTVAISSQLSALSFCCELPYVTVRQGSKDAKAIAIATLHNRQQLPGGDEIAELRISHVLRGKEFLGGQSVIQLPRFVRVKDPKNPPTLLVFIDVFKNQLDPYRGVPI